MCTLGELLRQHRTKNGLTMQQVADAIGTTKSYIHDLEHGVSEPGLRKAARLSMVFGISLNEMASCLKQCSACGVATNLTDDKGKYICGACYVL